MRRGAVLARCSSVLLSSIMAAMIVLVRGLPVVVSCGFVV
jgi:hypothetical protein